MRTEVPYQATGSEQAVLVLPEPFSTDAKFWKLT